MKVTVLQKPKRNRTGAQPVYVRLSHGGREAYVSLAVSVEPKHWNARRGEVRAAHPDADAVNSLVSERVATATRVATEAVLRSGRGVPVQAVKELVVEALHPSREAEVPILPWMKREVERAYAQRGQVNTAAAYRAVLANLQTSLAAQGLPAGRVTGGRLTLPVLNRHRDRLERPKSEGGCGHRPNTLHKQITTLRALLRRAVKQRVPGAREALEAAEHVEVKRERPERVRLTIEQVRGFLSMELSGRAADVRDWWCFSFFAGGVRLGDVCRLRWADVQRDDEGRPVAYRMRSQKTGALLALPLAPEAAAIVRRWEARTLGEDVPEPSPYVFGLLEEADEASPKRLRRAVDSRGAVARKHLARIAKREGWGKVGFHSARHSLADHMRKAGASIYDVSKVLGHSKISTTEAYLAAFDEVSAGAALLSSLAPEAGSPEAPSPEASGEG